MNIKEVINTHNIKEIKIFEYYPVMTHMLVSNRKVAALFPHYEKFELWKDVVKTGCFEDISRASMIVVESLTGGIIVHSRKSAKTTYAQLCKCEYMLGRFEQSSIDYSAEIARMISKDHYGSGYGDFGLSIKKVNKTEDFYNYFVTREDKVLLLYSLDGKLLYQSPLAIWKDFPDITQYGALVAAVPEKCGGIYIWHYVLLLCEDNYNFVEMSTRLAAWFTDMPSRTALTEPFNAYPKITQTSPSLFTNG